jgi:multidrug efflux pump subunit AcrB
MRLQRPIQRLEGVARVELQGVEPREVRVLVDPTRLAAYSVDVQQLRNLLVQSIAAGTVGSLADGRGLVAAAFPPERFEPRHPERWERLARVFGEITPR